MNKDKKTTFSLSTTRELASAVDNMEDNYAGFCETITKIVKQFPSYKEAAFAILGYEKRLSKATLYKAYMIGSGKLIPQAVNMQDFRTVEFICKNATVSQQKRMLEKGILVCSRKHPDGHWVSFYNWKHCQIRYSWNSARGRLMTARERHNFSKEEFTAALQTRFPIQPKKSKNFTKDNFGFFKISGSYTPEDLDSYIVGLKEKPITLDVTPESVFREVYSAVICDNPRRNIATVTSPSRWLKYSFEPKSYAQGGRIIIHGAFTRYELVRAVHDLYVLTIVRRFNAMYPDAIGWAGYVKPMDDPPPMSHEDWEKIPVDGFKECHKGEWERGTPPAEEPCGILTKTTKTTKKARKAKIAK